MIGRKSVRKFMNGDGDQKSYSEYQEGEWRLKKGLKHG